MKKSVLGKVVASVLITATVGVFSAAAVNAGTYDYGSVKVDFRQNYIQYLNNNEFQCYYETKTNSHGQRSGTHYYTKSKNGMVRGAAYSYITYIDNAGKTRTPDYNGKCSGTGWVESDWVELTPSVCKKVTKVVFYGEKYDNTYGDTYAIDKFTMFPQI